MTSPLPPRLRDTVSDTDLIRKGQTNLRQLGVGFLSGRYPPARPLGTTAGFEVSDEELDFGVDQIEFNNTDQGAATVAGIVSAFLTYAPIDGSLHVRLNGLDFSPTEWTYAGGKVTLVNPHVHVGDILFVAYAYYPSDVVEPDPFSLEVRGTTKNTGLLPVETQVGDFIVVAARWGFGASIDFSGDSRLTHISSAPGGRGGIWVGNATSLSALAYTGTVTKVVVVAYVGSAAFQTSSSAISTSSLTPATPSPLTGNAAIVVMGQRSSVVPGGLGPVAAPWILDENSGDAQFVSVRVYHWFDFDGTTTPSVAATWGAGGLDEVDAVLFTVAGV
jgi:hypothetical protein